MRIDGRENNELRPVRLQPGALRYPEGSCLVEFGDTRVLCAASVEDRVPPHRMDTGEGWVTAEYGMLPRAGLTRSQRESRAAPRGRSQEIERLIGRSLRAVTDLRALGERTVILDCDVLQADGGTRTAAITGAFVALALAGDKLVKDRVIKRVPLREHVAAVSAGAVAGQELLDLCYTEDSRASVDLNLVLSGRGQVVEVQSTGEAAPFPRQQLDRLIDLAAAGIRQLFELQREALGDVAIG